MARRERAVNRGGRRGAGVTDRRDRGRLGGSG
jgi:hypothetical protein